MFRCHYRLGLLFVCSMSCAVHSNGLSDDVFAEHLTFSGAILSQRPNLIKRCDGARIYIREDCIREFDSVSSEVLIEAEDGSLLWGPVPARAWDGYFYHAKRLFKNVCNVCGFEWEAGGIEQGWLDLNFL